MLYDLTLLPSRTVLVAVQPASVAAVARLVQPTSSKVHYILTGTFNTIFLYLLAFNPTTSTLHIQEKIRGEGPHQFWALNQKRDRAYATTWAMPPTLSAWRVKGGGREGMERINTVPITATSSYISLSPLDLGLPPRIYSAGGPTGEIHSIDSLTGGFGTKLQQLLYVENEEELVRADKTRVALRYGSHGIDLNLPDSTSHHTKKQAFVPHLGHNSIFMYDVNETDGTLDFVADVKSFGDGHDGPRHVVPSPDGTKLYAVTEHTSYVDVYAIESSTLSHLQRLSVIPPSEESSRLSYRGDTLRLSQDGTFLFVTTRGKTPETRGYVSVWSVNPSDNLLGGESTSSSSPKGDQNMEPFAPLERFQTRTSGGKANAIETFPFHPITRGGLNEDQKENQKVVTKDWILLTDDQDGWVSVLEWTPPVSTTLKDSGQKGTLLEIAAVRLGEGEEDEEKGVGASHAVWLS